MSRWYPHFRLIRTPFLPPRWQGTLRPFRSRLNFFEVALAYRSGTTSIPLVWIVDPEVSRRTHPEHPHLNSDGSACTFFVPDRNYDPEIHPLSFLVDLTLDWLRRHLYWTERLVWPGPAAPHDPLAIVKELRSRPNAPCICGNGKPFRECHGGMYHAAARRQARGQLHNARRVDPHRLKYLLESLRRDIGPARMAELLPHLGPPPYLYRRSFQRHFG